MTEQKQIAPEAVAIIVRGAGVPGEVRHGFRITTAGSKRYFTDDEERAKDLANAIGVRGRVTYQSLICHTPGCWSPFDAIPATDGGMTAEDIQTHIQKQEALSKLTTEERVILGLA